jgi:chemotaxis protein MotB
MITLLLALFIVLFAMSTIDVVRFDALKRTLSQTFNGQITEAPGGITEGASSVLDPNAAKANDAPTTVIEQERLDQASAQGVSSGYLREKRDLKKAVDKLEKSNSSLKGKIDIVTTERGIVIRLAGDTFFASGSAELREELTDALKPIAKDIRVNQRQIRVEGHTDGAPIHSALYQDNLALSQARSAAVYRYLIAQGVPMGHIVGATGFGATQPLEAPPAGFATMSIAKNRRVEIVILAPGSETETNPASKEDGHDPRVPRSPHRNDAQDDKSSGSDFNIVGPIVSFE